MNSSWRVFVQYLKESLIWSDAPRIHPSRLIISMLSLLGPIVVGLLFGYLKLGFNIAIAGYLVANDDLPKNLKRRAIYLLTDVIVLTSATALGILLYGKDLSSKLIYLTLVVVAALLGGMGKFAARVSTLFIVMMVIARNLGSQGADPFVSTLLFFVGCLWIVVLIFTLRPILFKIFPEDKFGVEDNASDNIPLKVRISGWMNSLKRLSGWLFALRLITCLLVAETLLYFWPNEHDYWVYITIALVVQRNLHESLKRKIQRSIGTLAGVLLASFLLIWYPPLWFTILTMSFLAGTRPLAKVKNYAAYSFNITLFVMMLLGLSQPTTIEILLDRLWAAFLGSGIAFIFGFYFWRKKLNLN